VDVSKQKIKLLLYGQINITKADIRHNFLLNQHALNHVFVHLLSGQRERLDSSQSSFIANDTDSR